MAQTKLKTQAFADSSVSTPKIADQAVTGAKQYDSGWVAVTMLNSWVNYDTSYGVSGLTYIRKIGNVVPHQGSNAWFSISCSFVADL